MTVQSWYEKNYSTILKAVAFLFVCIAVFFLGYAKGSPKTTLRILGDWSSQAVEVLDAAWEQTLDNRPKHFLQPSRKPGKGVTVNLLQDNTDLVLLTGFFDGDPGLRLVKRDGTIVAAWRAEFSKLLPERVGKPGAPQTDWNVDLHGSYLEPDGSIVFNFEYQGAVRLSRCGERLWALPNRTHHSVEPAAGGGYWIGGRFVEATPNAAEYRPLVPPARETGVIEDDVILRVSAAGQILEKRSIYTILMDNGFESMLTATGESLSRMSLEDNELLHLNMIQELSPDLARAFPEFNVGDLVISVRDYNLVFVVDPHNWKVKWHHVGPWLRQHSAQFLSDGTIAVFNNNVYTYQSGPDEVTDLSQPRVSQILAINPKTDEVRRRYGTAPGQEMLSVVRGYQQERPEGGLLITEPGAGRVFQIDAAGKIVWEYINRYDAEHVLEMTGARAYPAAYFTVKDWGCL